MNENEQSNVIDNQETENFQEGESITGNFNNEVTEVSPLTGDGSQGANESLQALEGDNEAFDMLFKSTDEEFAEMLKANGVEEGEGLQMRKEFIAKATQQVFQKDLQEIKRKYSFVTANDIKNIKNFDKFALLRSKGLDALSCFEAVAGKDIAENFLKTRNKSNGAFSAMKKLGLKESGSSLSPIPRDELNLWKSAFPSDSLAELTKKYNKAKLN